MAKHLLFIPVLLIQSLLLFSEERVHVRSNLQTGRVPDFVVQPEPMPITEHQAISPLLQVGPKTFRANLTYGGELFDDAFGKVTLEYLSQKMGFNFKSHMDHRWVQQGAIGLEYGYVNTQCFGPITLNQYSFGLSSSCSSSKSIKNYLLQESHELMERRIAGVTGYSAHLQGTLSLWQGGEVKLLALYDYLNVRKKLESKKVLQGPGFGINYEQVLWKWKLQLQGELHSDYLLYGFRLTSHYFDYGRTGTMTFFGERVRGYHGLSSSSRTGIEFGFAFGPLRRCSERETEISCSLYDWMKTPAVKMAEVLVSSDKRVNVFGKDKTMASLQIPDADVPFGSFSLPLGSYFSSPSSLIFGSSGLPPGFSIDPLTGVLSGFNDGSLSGSFTATITATNYFGSASQTITLIF